MTLTRRQLAVALGVLLPADATTNHFDFLVTLRAKPMERLQAALRRKLGYSARMQERYVEVMRLTRSSLSARARATGLRQAGC